jgi:nucleotide-binding universal stress UspA family protein
VTAVRRIVVGVHGSLGSLQALRWAADEAQERQVPLMPVIAWVPPSALMEEMRRGLRPWPLHSRRVLVPDLEVPELPGE